MYSKWMAAVALAISALGLAAGVVQEKDPVQPNASKFMDKKLDAARDIVSGLATEDHQKIAKNAQALMLLSHESEWKVFQTQLYADLSNEFRASAGRLRDQANQSNLDGATLAYFEVTLSCVRCHKYVRKTRKTPR